MHWYIYTRDWCQCIWYKYSSLNVKYKWIEKRDMLFLINRSFLEININHWSHMFVFFWIEKLTGGGNEKWLEDILEKLSFNRFD